MKYAIGGLLLWLFWFVSLLVWAQESTDTYPGQVQIEDSFESLSNIESYTQVLEQKQSDTEARVNSIESTVSEISGSLKKLQETSEQAWLSKDLQLKESEAKSKKLERTLSFFRGFSVATGIGSIVSTLLLVVVVVL